jgi:hypothetical protein
MIQDDDAVMTFPFEKINDLAGARQSFIFFLFLFHVMQYANSDKICILRQERKIVSVPFALYLALLVIRANDSNLRLVRRCLLGHILCTDTSSKYLFGFDSKVFIRLV